MSAGTVGNLLDRCPGPVQPAPAAGSFLLLSRISLLCAVQHALPPAHTTQLGDASRTSASYGAARSHIHAYQSGCIPQLWHRTPKWPQIHPLFFCLFFYFLCLWSRTHACVAYGVRTIRPPHGRMTDTPYC